MNNYVVFIKDKESKVISADKVTRDLIKDLKNRGFSKYHSKIEANSEKEAIQKINSECKEQLNALSEYAGNVFFYCAVLVISLIMAYIFSR